MIPIRKLNSLSDELNIDLRMIDESYFPSYLGGSKARKIIPIINDAKKYGSNAIVSAGSANSNHARVVALAAAELGWKCHLIIHDNEDYTKANLQLMKLSGANLTFCSLDQVAVKMDEAMALYQDDGLIPYYIWGGGHGVEGTSAFYDAVHEYQDEFIKWTPDYIFRASGTGGTQAGLHVGFAELFPESKVIGISVARTKERGQQVVCDEANLLAKKLGLNSIEKNEIYFYDEWVGGGYGMQYPELLATISHAAKNEGLITDPTYTGKALTALFDMVAQNKIPQDSNVLFWHSGGIFNLFEFYKDL